MHVDGKTTGSDVARLLQSCRCAFECRSLFNAYMHAMLDVLLSQIRNSPSLLVHTKCC